MPTSISKTAGLRRIGAGLWGVFAVVLLSIAYVLNNMGLDNLKIIMIIMMVATAGMLFNRGSRRLLIIPAVISLACFMMAFVLQR
ncbi:MFS transporter [Providencia rettgeri]|nr:MFS transporter [Providencia rettgeri]